MTESLQPFSLLLARVVGGGVGRNQIISHPRSPEGEKSNWPFYSWHQAGSLGKDKCPAGIATLEAVVAEANSPELVNDVRPTAPSKRIIKRFSRHRGLKSTVGFVLAHRVKIGSTRSRCAHFDVWVKTLESLG